MWGGLEAENRGRVSGRKGRKHVELNVLKPPQRTLELACWVLCGRWGWLFCVWGWVFELVVCVWGLLEVV